MAGAHQKSRFLLSQFRVPDDADFLSGSDMIFSFSARTAQSIRVELCNSNKSFALFNVIFRLYSIDFCANIC